MSLSANHSPLKLRAMTFSWWTSKRRALKSISRIILNTPNQKTRTRKHQMKCGYMRMRVQTIPINHSPPASARSNKFTPLLPQLIMMSPQTKRNRDQVESEIRILRNTCPIIRSISMWIASRSLTWRMQPSKIPRKMISTMAIIAIINYLIHYFMMKAFSLRIKRSTRYGSCRGRSVWTKKSNSKSAWAFWIVWTLTTMTELSKALTQMFNNQFDFDLRINIRRITKIVQVWCSRVSLMIIYDLIFK